MSVRCEWRTRRGDIGAGASVTEREAQALEFIARAQPVSTLQYGRLLQLHPRLARRSLAKLRALGCVDAHLPAGLNAPNFVTLAPAGRALLASRFDSDPDSLWVPKAIRSVQLEHHLVGVDVGVALVSACRGTTGWSLVALEFEHGLRQRLGRRVAGAQVPDLAAVLQRRDGHRVAIAFEVDLGHEAAAYVERTKVRPYVELHTEGVPLLGERCWRVAFVISGASERRLVRLAELTVDGVPEGLFHFALASEVTADSVLGTAWRSVHVRGDEARLEPVRLLAPGPTDPSDGWTGRTSESGASAVTSPMVARNASGNLLGSGR